VILSSVRRGVRAPSQIAVAIARIATGTAIKPHTVESYHAGAEASAIMGYADARVTLVRLLLTNAHRINAIKVYAQKRAATRPWL
jgi:hypothetical protein